MNDQNYRKNENLEIEYHDCMICGARDWGEYTLNWVEDRREASGIRVTERGCFKCWSKYNKFVSRLQNFYKYGMPHPGIPDDMNLRRFVMKNESIRKALT